ncbi:hypothetical protein [Arenicella xantha]|uniref:Uncharacterized protein n=1 Tax=Arenicella xantha TaxID=644221 RepID=A0A395JL88_9GAMM|nr:hypothetical protein [Arenicella xantha]RBP50607.1 hypothetical protein DFR28_10218 [Arenicella xantha]
MITNSFNNCFENAIKGGVGCSAIGLVSSDSRDNGLQHQPLLEANSNLHSAGEEGDRIGANITNKTGIDGSLWSDPGFDMPSIEPLRPWPYQERISNDMRTAILNGANTSARCRQSGR